MIDCKRTARDSREQRVIARGRGQGDDRVAMGRDHMENLREGASRLANEQTRITERMEETSAVTGRDHCKDRRQRGGFWCRKCQMTRKRHEE